MSNSPKLTTEEVAALYKMAPNTFEKWRCKNRGPKYAKMGRRVLYDLADVEAFFAARTIQTAESEELETRKGRKS